MDQELLKELRTMSARLGKIEATVASLSEKGTLPPAPVMLRRAAEICEVEKDWLLDKVQLKEIPAFREGENKPWRVYVRDVLALLTRETSIAPQRPATVQSRRQGRKAA